MVAEFELINRHFRRDGDARARGVVCGIGDDAALLAMAPGQQLAACTDTLVAGVHFPPDTPADAVGWKALAVNLSDLAAMGATPRSALLALTLPAVDDDWVADFARGFFALADATGCALVGGDTTRGPLSVTVTALGEVPAGEALRRDGAQVGDLVCVSGTPGLAALGLARWQAGTRDGDDPAVAALLRPQPRLALGRELRGVASACIDVSDGLLADLAHVLAASSADGVARGAELQLAALPRAGLLSTLDEAAARDCQLAGGDDYELCFTLAPTALPALRAAAATAGVPVAVIGRVTGDGRLRCLDAQGNEHAAPRRGWEHFHD